jgi:hypothetical protein
LTICIFVIKVFHSKTYTNLAANYYTWEELMQP